MSQERFTNDKGRTFTVRIVREGDAYGLNDCLRNDDPRPMVEFYDATYDTQKSWDFDPVTKGRGQFISRYFAETLLETPFNSGLCLHGGKEDVWSIDGTTMGEILAWAVKELDSPLEVLNRALDAIIDVASKE